MNKFSLSATVAAVGLIALPAAAFALPQDATAPGRTEMTSPPASETPPVDAPVADPMAQPPVEAAPPADAAPPATQPAAGGTIADVAMSNPDFSTLVTAVKAANLAETLQGAGPFTVFAPANYAFAKLPDGTVDNLVKPENQSTLQGVLTYHVIAGKVGAGDLAAQIDKAGGTLSLTTVNGATLTAKRAGQGVTLTDAKGNVANITAVDVAASNGVIHVIDGVLMPA